MCSREPHSRCLELGFGQAPDAGDRVDELLSGKALRHLDVTVLALATAAQLFGADATIHNTTIGEFGPKRGASLSRSSRPAHSPLLRESTEGRERMDRSSVPTRAALTGAYGVTTAANKAQTGDRSLSCGYVSRDKSLFAMADNRVLHVF